VRRAEKAVREGAKLREKEIQNETRQAKIDKKERRLEHDRRRMENEYKSAQRSAQVMRKDVGLKMRAMNKKQLRQIKKTRMNTKTGVVEYVPAYTK